MFYQNQKVIITAAITGSIHTPSMSPALPRTPDEIICDAVAAARAGAAIIHVHAREENGRPTTDFGIYEKILSSIKRECDAVISLTTGGAQGMPLQERFSVIERFRPEIATCNAGSMNFCYKRLADRIPNPTYDWEIPSLTHTWDNVFKNTFADLEYSIGAMYGCGTLPEFEIYDYGQLNNIAHLLRLGIVKKPIYIQFVPGVMGGMPANQEGISYLIRQAKELLGEDVIISSVAPGRRMFRFATFVALQGGNVRVGMEDGLYISANGTPAPGNREQVEKMRRILEELDFEIATPQEVRQTFGLKGMDQVNF